ncbi:IS3 family transposase [Micromonospora sp. GCM10011542]|uniref:IS3 family transposase n=1 Tax=Micromonospora sp. GCM10011542 TaxID=3317337 RepID=UPI0036130F89
MSSVADCYDNALAETFFATLKTELVYTHAWPSRHELGVEVFSYIEGFYNPRRRHSRLGNVSPDTYEPVADDCCGWGSLSTSAAGPLSRPMICRARVENSVSA